MRRFTGGHFVPGWLFLVFVLVIAAVVGYRFYAAAQRRKELSAWAEAHALRFDRAKNHSMDSRLSEFRCLRQGRSRYAYNIMKGQWGDRPVLAFDYHYTTGSGKNRQNHYFSAVVLASPVPLKPLFIRREGFFDKVTEFFGFDDIDFESAEFSRKFFVKSPDKRWAYAVIHQRMMEFLLREPGFSIEFGPTRIMAWRSSKLSSADFERAIGLVDGMIDRLPEYLVREQADMG